MSTFTDLYTWWMQHPSYWFNATKLDDIEIANKWRHLDNLEINIDLDQLSTMSKENIIGHILYHDQIIRHIVRADNLSDCLIKIYLDKIIELSKKYYLLNKLELEPELELEGYDFCFVLLPQRHTKDFYNCEFVINETWSKINSLNNLDPKFKIYKNYLKASYERCSVKPIKLYIRKNIDSHIHENIEKFIIKYREILDIKSYYEYSQNYMRLDLTNPIVKSCNKINKSSKLIVSISGGVDSMILSWILKKLNFDFVLVHINYSNRTVCEQEKAMLFEWASYLQVEIYYRDIYEINRKKCMDNDMRSIYEEYTRDIRFNAYVQTANQKNWNSEYMVILGHNYDDCIENILTNITNKNKYENLDGMEFISDIVLDNNIIKLCRPILSINKIQIYDYAKLNSIPFLFDSTPAWTQRGQIRDLIKPCLESWNSNSIKGLSELSKIMKESLECVDLVVDLWISKLTDTIDPNNYVSVLSKITLTNIKFIMIGINELTCNKIFWNRLLIKLNFMVKSKMLNEIQIKSR